MKRKALFSWPGVFLLVVVWCCFVCSGVAHAKGGAPLRTFKVGGAALAFSPDSKTLAAGGFKQIRLFDVATGKLLHTLKGHTASIVVAVYSPDGKWLATASNPYMDGENEDHPTAKDFAVNIWDARTGKLKRTLVGHRSVVVAAAFSRDGKSLATGGDDKLVNVWNVARGQLKRSWKAHGELVLALAYSPDPRTLASGSVLELKLWDPLTGKLKRQLPGIDESVRGLAFHDSTLVSISQNGKIHLFDTMTWKLKRLINTNTMLTSVNLTPSGQFYARGSWSTGLEERAQGEVSVHSTQTGSRLAGVAFRGGLESLAIAPNLKLFAVGGSNGESSGTVTLWTIP